MSEETIINDLHEKQPDIIFIALGTPYQELVIDELTSISLPNKYGDFQLRLFEDKINGDSKPLSKFAK